MTRNEQVQKRKNQKFKDEVESIEYRLVESMANLDLLDKDMTKKLYKALDTALYELTRVKTHVENGTEPFKLPEGYREKMTQDLIEVMAEGKDYSGYIYEQSEAEVLDMTDEDFYENYFNCLSYVENGEEQDKYIKTIQDILTKEKLEEAINE